MVNSTWASLPNLVKKSDALKENRVSIHGDWAFGAFGKAIIADGMPTKQLHL
ncbi:MULTISPECIES: hypothetical protein [unclassified Moorena]|uniref:hypothetical protein n=1 Tax=unclassified Moorena TaxID=2683338 RepID=UPI00140059D3|nr:MULTISPECIES: hypothetical protein [unclassified Moorena]NEO16747.1 hypothetical protein [Moorena sp. SIO3E8]NEQ03282.1 hypothetical protein [Moorena sp. SIO3F7]